VPRSERNKDSSAPLSTSAGEYVPRSQRQKEDSSTRAARLKSELDSTPERPSERYVPRSERTKDTSTGSSSYERGSLSQSAAPSYTSSRTEKKDSGSTYRPSFQTTYTTEANAAKRDYSSVKPYEGRSGTTSLASSSLASSSVSRGGVEKPKKQVEHERQLEKIKKDFEGDYKKKAIIQLERKVLLSFLWFFFFLSFFLFFSFTFFLFLILMHFISDYRVVLTL
jgi:hypothetical protein